MTRRRRCGRCRLTAAHWRARSRAGPPHSFGPPPSKRPRSSAKPACGWRARGAHRAGDDRELRRHRTGVTGPAGTFVELGASRYQRRAVGSNHIVEVVTTDIAVLTVWHGGLGPVPINTL
jgi:hypothetical protein